MIPFLVIVLMFWLLIVFTLFVSTPEEQEDVEFDRETIVAIEQSIATGQFGAAYSLAQSLRSAGLQKEMRSRVAENAISHLQAEAGATLTPSVFRGQLFRLLHQTGFHPHRSPPPEEQEDVEFDQKTIVAIEQSIATGQFGTAYSLAKSLRSAGLQKEMCSRVAENAISHLQAEVGATLTEPVSESQFFRLLLQTGFHSHRTLTPPKEDGADR